MKEKMMSVCVKSLEDMAVVEREIGRIMGCEQRKCSLVGSHDFVSLRLCALYGRGGVHPPFSVFRENLQVSLDDKRMVTVYLLVSDVSPLEDTDVVLGKRGRDERWEDLSGDETRLGLY